MRTAIWPVQVALVTRLKNTAGVTARVGQRIYDGEAPQGAVMPYIVIGESTSIPRDTFDRDGVDETVEVNIWSRYAGRYEVLAILSAVDAALETPLTVTGWGTVRLRSDFVTVLVEEDGIRRVPARYRVIAFKE